MAWRRARAPDRPCPPSAMPRHLDAGTDRSPPPVWRPQSRAWLPAKEARRSRRSDAQPGLATRAARFRSRSGGFRRGGARGRAPHPRPPSHWLSSCRRPSPAQLRLALDIAAGLPVARPSPALPKPQVSSVGAASTPIRTALKFLCCANFHFPPPLAGGESTRGAGKPTSPQESKWLTPRLALARLRGRVRVGAGVILRRTLTHGLAATRRTDLGAQRVESDRADHDIGADDVA